MTDRRVRDTLITFFPMFIATISVVAMLYQSWLFARSDEVMQRAVDRGEIMRACKDVIDAYFQVRLKVGMNAAGGPGASVAATEATSAVAKFGSVGTYLANFNEEGARERYTRLAHELARIVLAARATQSSEVEKLFGSADGLFAGLNDDCVRTARTLI